MACGAALTRPRRSVAHGRWAAVYEGFHDRLVWGTSLALVARGPLELGSTSNSTTLPTFLDAGRVFRRPARSAMHVPRRDANVGAFGAQLSCTLEAFEQEIDGLADQLGPAGMLRIR
jgi:hypothetical protein